MINKGLVILGIPTNTFGWQEPLIRDELKDSVAEKFNPNFQLFQRAEGDANTHPLFLFLQNQPGGSGMFGKGIKSSWTKFLIGRDGKIIKRYGINKNPDDIIGDIEKSLVLNSNSEKSEEL